LNSGDPLRAYIAQQGINHPAAWVNNRKRAANGNPQTLAQSLNITLAQAQHILTLPDL
jgi:hypothetical protein